MVILLYSWVSWCCSGMLYLSLGDFHLWFVCLPLSFCILLCCDSSATVRVFLFLLAYYNFRHYWSSFLFWFFYWLENDILRWGNDAVQILIMDHFDFLFHCFHRRVLRKSDFFFLTVHTNNLHRIIMVFVSHTHAARCSLFHRNLLFLLHSFALAAAVHGKQNTEDFWLRLPHLYWLKIKNAIVM